MDYLHQLNIENVNDFYNTDMETLKLKEIHYIFKYALFQFNSKYRFIIYAPSLKKVPNFRSYTPKKYFQFVVSLLKKNDTIPFEKSNNASHYFITDKNTKNKMLSFLKKTIF
jgi:hypothetical protein